MGRLIWMLIIGICIVSCTQENRGATETTLAAGVSPADWAEQDGMPAMSGASAYYIACAACHETGANGAPLSGDPQAWADRSPLWLGVLAEHANKGYMEMPAKGGRVELPDDVVIRAMEYMLSLAYPERLPD
jgi:cytochrome c5